MIVNGKEIAPRELSLTTLKDLVAHFGLDPRSVAIEMNGEIPARDRWSDIYLKDSDRIEMIRFVGGG